MTKIWSKPTENKHWRPLVYEMKGEKKNLGKSSQKTFIFAKSNLELIPQVTANFLKYCFNFILTKTKSLIFIFSIWFSGHLWSGDVWHWSGAFGIFLQQDKNENWNQRKSHGPSQRTLQGKVIISKSQNLIFYLKSFW